MEKEEIKEGKGGKWKDRREEILGGDERGRWREKESNKNNMKKKHAGKSYEAIIKEDKERKEWGERKQKRKSWLGRVEKEMRGKFGRERDGERKGEERGAEKDWEGIMKEDGKRKG